MLLQNIYVTNREKPSLITFHEINALAIGKRSSSHGPFPNIQNNGKDCDARNRNLCRRDGAFLKEFYPIQHRLLVSGGRDGEWGTPAHVKSSAPEPISASN